MTDRHLGTGAPGQLHQRRNGFAAQRELADLCTQLVHRAVISTRDIADAIEDIPRLYALTESHLVDRLASARGYIAAGQVFPAKEDIEVIARALLAPTPAPKADVPANGADVLQVLVKSLGGVPTGDHMRTRGDAHALVGALASAMTEPARRVRTMLDPIGLANEPVTPELRRSAAAAGIACAELTPDIADWLLDLPRVHEQRQTPTWFASLQQTIGGALSHVEIAKHVEQLIVAHAKSGRCLAAFWARELRIRISVLGENALDAPFELAAASVVGVFAAKVG